MPRYDNFAMENSIRHSVDIVKHCLYDFYYYVVHGIDIQIIVLQRPSDVTIGTQTCDISGINIWIHLAVRTNEIGFSHCAWVQGWNLMALMPCGYRACYIRNCKQSVKIFVRCAVVVPCRKICTTFKGRYCLDQFCPTWINHVKQMHFRNTRWTYYHHRWHQGFICHKKQGLVLSWCSFSSYSFFHYNHQIINIRQIPILI